MRVTSIFSAAAVVLAALTLVGAPSARGDTVAYLVNVTVRPGYNFANAQQAIDYGSGICDSLRRGQNYSELVGRVQRDFHSDDPYQGSYLISQAVNELCPVLIWQLRKSAGENR